MRVPRREFVAGTLAMGACLVSGCATQSKPSTGTAAGKKLGVALLGLGDYARSELAPALKRTQHCELRGVVTGSPDKVPHWQREFGFSERNVYDYSSLPSIANNPDIDVVYVVTPTGLHAKYAIMAAEAGKHVWCEKPMALHVAECQSMIDACNKNGVKLCIGYRMHHEPNTQTVTQWGHERPYGPIRKVTALAGDKADKAHGWRLDPALGGGALYDMGVYSINAIRYASGEEPLRVVRARQWTDRPELFRDVDENSEFELALPSGVVAYGKASRAESVNSLQVEAERGSYVLEPMQSYQGVHGHTSDGKQLDRTVDMQQRQQMDDDALAILEGRAPMVPGEEGQRDIRIVNAIMEAARTGGSVTI